MKDIIEKMRLLIVAILALIASIPYSYAACLADEGGVSTQPLIAGQSIDAGTVSMEVVGSDLIVTYSTNGGWSLSETHVWVGSSLTTMPQTRKGTPKIGNFPYNDGNLGNVTSHSVSIPLNDVGFSCPNLDTTYYVAAHAVVVQTSGGEVLESETAWSAGDRFVEKGMWGTFTSIVLSCDCGIVRPPSDGKCETAFAFSGGTNAIDRDITNSFLDIDEDGDTVGDFSRWGWSNGVIDIGNYVWDVYAGAGQSDITKGTLVGSLYVNHSGSDVEVTYDISSPYVTEEIHLYVGDEILPRDNRGRYTVAPGQYSIVDTDLNDQHFNSYIINDISGGVYVVAHGVICGISD